MLNPIAHVFAIVKSLLRTLESSKNKSHLYEEHREELRSLFNEWMADVDEVSSDSIAQKVENTNQDIELILSPPAYVQAVR